MDNNPLFRFKPDLKQWLEYGLAVGFIQPDIEPTQEVDPFLTAIFSLERREQR